MENNKRKKNKYLEVWSYVGLNKINSNEDIYGKDIFKCHNLYYNRDNLSINKVIDNNNEVKHIGWSREMHLDCCAIAEYGRLQNTDQAKEKLA